VQRFREHVLSESPEALEDCLTVNETDITTEENTETAEVIPTTANATRSGRVPKAVLGNRLIDQI